MLEEKKRNLENRELSHHPPVRQQCNLLLLMEILLPHGNSHSGHRNVLFHLPNKQFLIYTSWPIPILLQKLQQATVPHNLA